VVDGTVGGVVVVEVVVVGGAGVVGAGFEDAGGLPAGGRGVVRVVGCVDPPLGRLSGEVNGAFCDEVPPFDP
jgi:hypothetical protein